MKTLNNKFYEQVKELTQEVLDQKEQGVSTREVMAQVYVDGLHDKTTEQGLIMADKALESIKKFNEIYAEAVENKDDCIDKLIEEMLESKSLVERCNILAQLYAEVEAANAKMAGEDENACNEIIEEADNNPISEDQATEQLAGELKDKVINVLQNKSIISRGLNRQADYIDNLIEEYGVSEMIVQIGDDEIEYEGLLTMISYVESKNADIKELPPDITIEETAYIVAATVEEERIIKRFSAGEIAMNVAVALLDTLAAILLLMLTASLVFLGAKVAIGLVGIILALPIINTLIVSGITLFGLALKKYNDIAKGTVKFVSNVIKIGAKAASFAMRKIGDFVTNTVIPRTYGIIQNVKSFFNNLKDKVGGSTVIVNNAI